MSTVTIDRLRNVSVALNKYHSTFDVEIDTNDHVSDALNYAFRGEVPGTWKGSFETQPKCMHSAFPGNAKQRRAMRRWHRKNNPTCNGRLMENLRLGRSCTG